MPDTKQTFLNGTSLEWRVNTPAFLKEIFDNNPSLSNIFFSPANIFRKILIEVAERASELNDPVMNALMCRLSLYGIADPYDRENYNHDLLMKVMESPEYLNYKKDKNKRKIKTAV